MPRWNSRSPQGRRERSKPRAPLRLTARAPSRRRRSGRSGSPPNPGAARLLARTDRRSRERRSPRRGSSPVQKASASPPAENGKRLRDGASGASGADRAARKGSPRSSPERRRKRCSRSPDAVHPRSPTPRPIATAPKAAPKSRRRRPEESPAPEPSPPAEEALEERSEAPKRKKRRRKDKAPTEETVPGVTPKAAPLAPPSLSPEAVDTRRADEGSTSRRQGRLPSAAPRADDTREANGEPLALHQAATKPKRRAKKPREVAEEPEPPQAAPLEANGAGDKEKPKRRKRRRPAEAEADGPPNDKPVEASAHRAATADQEMLLATVEDLAAPASAEDAPPEPAVQAPTRRRRRRKVQGAASAAEEAPKEPEEPPEADVKYGDLIRSVYQRNNPAKLEEVESLLEKWPWAHLH